MSEKFPSFQESDRPTISHDEALNNPALRSEYKMQREKAIKTGRPVWAVRNIDRVDLSKDAHITYDYFYEEIARGYILGNDSDGYDVRGAIFEPTMYGYEQSGLANLSLDGPKDNYYEATATLEDYVRKTSIRRSVLE